MLVIELSKDKLDPDNILDIKDFISAYAGLVSIN